MEGYPGWILGSAFKIFFMWVGLVWRFYVFVWSPNNIDCSCAFLPSSPGPSQSLRHFALLCFVVGLGPRWCANLRIPRASCVDVQIIQESGQKGARENPWKSVKCQRKKANVSEKTWKSVIIFLTDLNKPWTLNYCIIYAFSRLPLVSPDFQGSCHGGLRYRCSRGWTWFDAWRSSRSCSAHEKY